MYTKSCVFTSSRGRSLSRIGCKVEVIPGGTYDQLCDLAIKRLMVMVNRPSIVYFVAGIPDICTNRPTKCMLSDWYLCDPFIESYVTL